jgi:cytochrome c-type biogenesis protein CcmH/NrfG
MTNMVYSIKGYRAQFAEHAQALNQAVSQVAAMESMARTNPANVQNLVDLGNAYMQMQQTGRAVEVFDAALGRPEITLQQAQAAAMVFAQMQDFAKLDTVLRKMVSLAPDMPEARCDLAALESITGRSKEALADLKLALDLNAQRLAQNPAANDLRKTVASDPRFTPLHSLPEFQKLVQP